MCVPFRNVHVLKRIVWLTRCLISSLLLFTVAAGAAWGQDITGVLTKTEDAAMVVPRDLVQRIGDRSVILHWEHIVDPHLAGYHVYRVPSTTGLVEPPKATVPTNHFVDFDVENGSTYRYSVR